MSVRLKNKRNRRDQEFKDRYGDSEAVEGKLLHDLFQAVNESFGEAHRQHSPVICHYRRRGA